MSGSRFVKSSSLIILFLLCFLIADTVYGQQIDIKNSSRYLTGGRYSWKICLSAKPSVLDSIAYVDYLLPPTFANSQPRVTKEESRNFSLNEVGQGEFGVILKVTYRSGFSTNLRYWLVLSDEKNDCGPTTTKSRFQQSKSSSRRKA